MDIPLHGLPEVASLLAFVSLRTQITSFCPSFPSLSCSSAMGCPCISHPVAQGQGDSTIQLSAALLLFLTLSHEKSQNPSQKSSRSSLVRFEGNISEVADKGEFRQGCRSSKCASTSCNHCAGVEQVANPKQGGVGKVCITLRFLFQDMNCGAGASLSR